MNPPRPYFTRPPAPIPMGLLEMLALVPDQTPQMAQLKKELEEAISAAQCALEAIYRTKEGPAGPQGLRGAQGLQGLPGRDGRNGKDGKNGQDGERGADGAAPSVQDLAQALRKSVVQALKGYVKDGAPGKDAEPVSREELVKTVIEELLNGKRKLPLSLISGLEARIAEIRNHAATKSQWRGGGDTVVAGTGVTITNTRNGNKEISATAVVPSWKTPPEAPNGVTTVFTVSSIPSEVVADGATFFDGAGYTYAAGQITFVNPPTQYVRYQ